MEWNGVEGSGGSGGEWRKVERGWRGVERGWRGGGEEWRGGGRGGVLTDTGSCTVAPKDSASAVALGSATRDQDTLAEKSSTTTLGVAS